MPTNAVVSPEISKRSLVAAMRSIDLVSAQAATAANACKTVSRITTGPPQACQRVNRSAPMSRSSQGDRDIKINITAAP